MKDSILTNEIIDFFNGKGRFSEINEVVGMAASIIPDYFINYFNILDEKSKARAAKLIVLGALGKNDNFSKYIEECVQLMLAFCIGEYQRFFYQSLPLIENFFKDEEYIQQWCSIADAQSSTTDSRKDWHYGLALWGVLYLLSSKIAVKKYDYLIKNASSQKFINSLIRAKETYDIYIKFREESE